MRHGVRAHLMSALACATCALASPVSALAAGTSPVHIDPSSPVAKEYALPLATARGAPPESGKSGALFGAGLKGSGPAAGRTPTASPNGDGGSPPPESSPPAAASSPPATTTVPGPATSTTGAGSTQATGRTRATGRTATSSATRASTFGTSSARPTRSRRRRQHGGRVGATLTAARVLRPGSGFGLLWMLVAGLGVVALGSAGGIALGRLR